MRPQAIAAFGAAAYAVFLAATIPASVVGARIASEAAGRVTLSQAAGTLWNGTARARVIAPGGPVFIDSIAWRFRPARLASGRLAFDVDATARGLDVRLQLARGFADWEARDVAAHVEAAFTTAFVPLLAAWRPDGTLIVSAEQVSWNEREARGQARVEWRNAGLALTEVKPLGNYRLDARNEGTPMQVTVSTLEGPLKVNGQGTFSPPSRFAFSGEARAEGADAKALEPLLDLMGPRRPDGARSLELRIN